MNAKRFLNWFVLISVMFSLFAKPGLVQPVQADPAGTALQFNGSNQYVTFGDTRYTNGTLTGSPTWNIQANSMLGASSLTFNGSSQYVTTGTGTAFDSATFTVETWFYRTGAGVGVTTGTSGITSAIPLLTKGTSEGETTAADINYFLGIDAASAKLVADFEEGAGGTSQSLNHPITGTTVIALNTWYHAAATYDGNKWQIFLNGNLENELVVGQPANGGGVSPLALATSIQSNGTTAQGYFAGRLDEARVWNYARTQSEIQANMNSEILTPTVGLLGRWGLNDAIGTTASNLNRLGLTSFTLEAWVKRAAGGATMTTGANGLDGTAPRPLAYPVLTKGMGEAESPANVNMNWFLGITSTGMVGADFEDTAGGANHPAWGTTPVAIGEWHHIAAIYNGSCWALYVDGSPDVLNTSVTACPNATPEASSYQRAALSAGINSTGGLGAGYFSGVIDEARVWNRALSASEISANKSLEITSGTGLVARWGMNENAGTTINSPIGIFPGILTNSPAWVTVYPDPTPPAAPQNLSAVPGTGSISLNWTANSETDLAGYNIYRSTTSPVTKGTPVNNTLLSSPAYIDNSVSVGLTYYYSVTAVDTSGNGSPLSAEANALLTPVPGEYGLDLGSGSAYVTFGDPAKLDLAQFTIETWFKRTGAGTPNTTGAGGIANAIPLVTHGSPESDGSNVDANWILVIDNASNTIAADFEDMATGLNHPVYGKTAITSNVWHHAAATYDGTTWRLYLDGQLETILAANATPRYDSIQKAGLGTMIDSVGGAHGHFQGLLDETRVWNFARSRAEIVADINKELTSGTGLAARWGFNEGWGSTVADSIATPANGTITGTGTSWGESSPFNLTFDTTPPDFPTNLMASPRPGAVQLEWTANTQTDLAGYNIYRSTTNPVTKGTPVNGALLTSPSYLDEGVMAGTAYYYAVTALDTSGNESGLSNEASVVPLPPPPAEALKIGSGNAYINLGDNADTATFTLETWLRRDGTGAATSTGMGGKDLIPLITNGTADAETAAADINYFFGIQSSDGVLCADFEEAQTGSTPGLNHPVCGTTSLQNGTWYHAAAAYDGATWKLYLNGALEATLAVGQPANAANISQLAFGTSMKTDNTALGSFNGTLDEVRIWNYARTQAQIAGTINTKINAPQTGLIGRWGMDEGAGTTVGDASGNAITGAITGSGYNWVAGSPFNAAVNLPPDEPVLVTPANGAIGVSADTTLSVSVSDPESQPLDVTFYGRPLQSAAGPDFTLVVIPDAQYYAATYPAIYNAQMNWVASNKITSNIVYVATLGDNVDSASTTAQWVNADAAYEILDAANMPYGVAAGNHDGAPTGTATFNTYFGTPRFSEKPYYGGHYGSDNDNHYDLFEASGLKFIVVYIEYDDSMISTNNAVLQWANSLLQSHSDRRAMVVSHNMLQGGTSTAFSTQGQTIYNALKGNPNLFLILGGHLDVASRRSDTFNGSTVYTLRSDFQSVDNQQSGYLRIMRFSPADDMMYVRTYSPTQNKDYDKSDAAQNNFTLPYTMEGVGFTNIATARNVLSGSTASISWTGLANSSSYEWFAIASDGTHQTPSSTWNFTTGGVNTAPVCNSASLTAMEDTSASISLSCTDADSDQLTYTIVSGPAHGTLSGTGADLTYTPALNYNGPDSFTFKANDGKADSDVTTASISITPVNDIPVCEPGSLTTAEDTSGSVTLVCSDVDGDSLTYQVVNPSMNGSASLDGAVLTYTPGTNFFGGDGVSFKANDGTADSAVSTVNITVTPVNDPPICQDVSITTNQGITGETNANCADIDNTSLTFSMVTNPQHGTAVVDGSTLRYMGGMDFSGTDNFTYRAWDGSVYSDAAAVTVTVNEVNIAPFISLQPANQTVNTGETTSFTAQAGGNPTPSVEWFISPDGGASWSKIEGATSTTYGFITQAEDNGKQYRATFTNSVGSVVTDVATLMVNYPPAAPTDLTATAAAIKQIHLTWMDASDNEAHFVVERSTTGSIGSFSLLTTLNAGVTSYSDTGLQYASEYCYRIRATNATGDSDYSNGACATTEPEPSNALDFGTGDAYVTFGNTQALALSQFTLETWFMREGAGTVANTGNGGITAIPLITKGMHESDGSSVDMNYFLGIDSAANTLAADFEDTATGANHPVKGTTAIQNNVWYHAAVTFDGVKWQLFLNGNLEAELAVSQQPRSDSIQHAGLGVAMNSIGATEGHFNGALDEVRIWNYARSQDEIISTINMPITNPQSGLVGHWGLNEGTGTAVSGSAGTAINGTISGSGYTWIAGAPFNITFNPPAAPTGLAATAFGKSIVLTWTDNADNETVFQVERSTTGSSGAYTLLATTPANRTDYDDTGLALMTEYCYRVSAVNQNGNSASTDPACATTGSEAAYGLALGANNAYVSLGDNADLSQFTLETWLKRDGAGSAITTGTGGETLIPVITNGTAEAENATADINYFFGIRGSDGVLCADFEEAQTGSSPSLNHPVCGTHPLTTGSWYHAAATYDGTTWKLYLNGALEATLEVGQPANTENTSQLAFGTSMKATGATAGFFDGTLDEVRIWDNARTQEQIQGTINAQIRDVQTGLVARYGMDEGTGTSISSSAGTAINGTITGSSYRWVAGAPFNLNFNHAPNGPVVVTPANGAAGVDTAPFLSVTASDPDNDPLTVTFFGRSATGASGPDFTLVALPDTQYYTTLTGGDVTFNAETQWVADHQSSQNIVFTTHLGDITESGGNDTTETQWQIADTAMSKLEKGTSDPGDDVPFGIVAGNHDVAGGTALFEKYFGAARFAGRPYYGGHFGTDNLNSYSAFNADGMSFIVLNLQCTGTMPPTAVLDWADALLKADLNRRGIVVCHTLFSTTTALSTEGTAVFNALSDNPNLFLMLGGHVPGTGQMALQGTDGHTIYLLLSDYQSEANGGNGWLRVMKFSPFNNEIQVTTYSPTLNQYKTDSANQFNLNYAMTGSSFTQVGTASVPSGVTASVTWNGLNSGTQYEWYSTVSDGSTTTGGQTWNFTTISDSSPSITAQPANQAVAAGQNVSFSAAADGRPVPTVQWQVSADGGSSWNNIPEATSTTYTFTAQAADNGKQYRAVFTNTAGSITTNAATLTVTFAPTIVAQPTDQTVNAGQKATFTASAIGNPIPTVLWQVSTDNGINWADLSGAASTSLTFTAQAADNGKQFRAVFSNSIGAAVISQAATLTVNTTPVITAHPQSITVAAGQQANFSAAAAGNPTPTLQWQVSTNNGKAWKNISGATSPTYSFTAQTTDSGKQVRAVFTNSIGTATTNAAKLTVTTVMAPVITSQPIDQIVADAQRASFTAAATGNPTPMIQWQVSEDNGSTWGNITGATSTTYSFTASSANNGSQFRAVFTNSAGSATTNAALLTVTSIGTAPVITTQPANQAVDAGQTASFTAAATGNPAPLIQWQVSTDNGGTWANISGAASGTYSFTTQASDDGKQFRAVFTNTYGTATSNAATLRVNSTTAPVITFQPASKTVKAGTQVTFTAAASGNPTPTVQWQVSTNKGRTWTDISGATEASYTFTALKSSSGNQYRAFFTNGFGTATTNAATLTVR